MKNKRYILIKVLALALTMLYSFPPQPALINSYNEMENVVSEIYGPHRSERGDSNLPQKILVLMVEFEDLRFEQSVTNVDFLADPSYTISDYVGRYLEHMKSYYLDVSDGVYEVDYVVLDKIFTLERPIGYYGESGRSLERRVELSKTLIKMADPVVDYSEYDAYIIFHAGSGKETDIYGTNPNSISSSFINRSLFQHILDRDNDDFPGLETEDGIHIKELIIAASNQDHPDNPEDLNYGILGLLCHLYGRQMGLPALFGNVPDIGRAAGAGNFCLMGTGVWNANGFVPPLLSAWLRYYLGWAQPTEVTFDSTNLKIAHPMTSFLGSDTSKLYKINISADEYFLIENRQQNPDSSTLGGQPNFTFQLLPVGEQEYYPPPYTMIPRFNFMKNSYRGCEWDFYLPGLGGPDIVNLEDGSGLLIWHIDEEVIRANIEHNTINANPKHQGITLIEADGIQHLRSSMPDNYMRGSPFDAFRKGHNDYFGKRYLEDGTLSIPFVESYYGNSGLEIYNISDSNPIMEFSVQFPDYLTFTGYGDRPLPLAMIDGSADSKYLFKAYETGELFLFQEGELQNGYPKNVGTIPHLYAVTADNMQILLPSINATGESELHLVSAAGIEKSKDDFTGYEWASHPIAAGLDGLSIYALLPFNSLSDNSSKIYLSDEDFKVSNAIDIEGLQIASNLVLRDSDLFYFVKDAAGMHTLERLDLSSFERKRVSVDLPSDFEIDSFTIAPITKKLSGAVMLDNLLVTGKDNGIYLFTEEGVIESGFPVYLSNGISSLPTLADVDGNGYLDILLMGSDQLYVIGYDGGLLTYPKVVQLEKKGAVNGRLGVVVVDNDGAKPHIISTLNGNRLALWDDTFRLLPSYPRIYNQQPLNTPYLVKSSSGIDAYLSAEGGVVYKEAVTNGADIDLSELWVAEYVNLQRSGYFKPKQLTNKFESSKLFVKDECYIFPNPVGGLQGETLYLNMMTNESILVEVKIFDITGKIIFQDRVQSQAYVRNRNKVNIYVTNLARGVYILQMAARDQVLTFKFAVEK
ncbi:MAG: T9SS type A sorting domain-containing protein [Candidatus Cloacimonadia bacterium]